MGKHLTIATYTHPDGAGIRFNADELLMSAWDGATSINVDIGPLGMIELIRIGTAQVEGQQ